MRFSGYVALNMAAQAASVLFYLLVARSNSPAEFGKAMFAVTTALVVGGLLNFGSTTFYVRELTSGRFCWNDVLLRSIGRLGYSVAAGVLLAIVFLAFVPDAGLLLAVGVASLTAGTNIAALAQVIPLASAKFTFAGIGVLVEKSIPLLLLLALTLLERFDSTNMPIIMAIGCFVGAMLTACSARMYRKNVSVDRLASALRSVRQSGGFIRQRSVLNPWRGSLHIGVSSAFYSVRQSDVALVRIVSSPEAAGEYAAVSKWNQPIALFASSIGNALLPSISAAASLRDAAFLVLKLWPHLALIAALSVTGAALSGWLVLYILGPEYSAAADVLIVVFLTMPIAFSRQIVYVLLVARQFDRTCSQIVALGVLLGLFTSAALAFSWGALGAAIAYSLTEVSLLLSLLGVLIWKRESR